MVWRPCQSQFGLSVLRFDQRKGINHSVDWLLSDTPRSASRYRVRIEDGRELELTSNFVKCAKKHKELVEYEVLVNVYYKYLLSVPRSIRSSSSTRTR